MVPVRSRTLKSFHRICPKGKIESDLAGPAVDEAIPSKTRRLQAYAGDRTYTYPPTSQKLLARDMDHKTNISYSVCLK